MQSKVQTKSNKKDMFFMFFYVLLTVCVFVFYQ